MLGLLRNPFSQEESFLADTNIVGTVQVSLPHIGKVLVRPNAAQSPTYVVCSLPGTDGIYGGTAISVPVPGSQVQVHVDKHDLKAYVVSPIIAKNDGTSISDISLLHTAAGYKTQSDFTFVQKFTQILQQQGNQFVVSSPCGIYQDTYPGDYIITQKAGPTIFRGRTQITLKGSDLAYIQLSAVGNKITTVAHKLQIDTANTKQTSQQFLNRYLVASDMQQSMGGFRSLPDAYPLEAVEQDGEIDVVTTPDCRSPLYRYQRIQGGLANGTHETVVAPLDQQQATFGQYSVAASRSLYNDGSVCSITQTSVRSIKTPKVSALQEIDQEADFSDSDHEQPKITSQDPLDKALLLDLMLRDSSQPLLEEKLSKQDRQSLQKFKVGYKTALDGLDPFKWEQLDDQVCEVLPDLPYVQVVDSFTGKTRKIIKATSFITQEDDGSVLIKDGWGSQIRMSKGNIYISSALDTFIRPGRNLIGMIPGIVQLDSNQGTVIASKQDIKVASQMSVNIASAVSGESGYTVIQNRSKQIQDGGLVLRSNGDMSVTASGDMFLGLNDKTRVNAGDKVTKGDGKIVIQGGDIAVHSSRSIVMAGNNLGIYGKSGSSGAGLQVTAANVHVVAPSVSMNTSFMCVGKKSVDRTVSPGTDVKDVFTVSSGSGQTSVVIKGSLSTGTTMMQGSLAVSSAIFAGQYASLVQNITVIPKVKNPGSTYRSIYKSQDVQLSVPSLDYRGMNIPWYKDAYICSKQTELYSSQDYSIADPSNYNVPKMCWQVSPVVEDYINLAPIIVYPTGQGEATYSYPGQKAWADGSMSKVQSGDANQYQISHDDKLLNAYTTNTKERKK